MKVLHAALRLLADETRLRALRVLAEHELNAGELTDVLGVAQSAVSRHLSLLRDGGLVEVRREGRYAYFSAARAAGPVWESVGRLVAAAPDEQGDLARLDDVLRARRERRLGGGSARRDFVPGRSWAAWARALTWLVPDAPRVVDLGCGDGALTLEIARFAGRVTAVDVRPALLRKARASAKRAGARNVAFKRADIADLPFDDAAFDLAVLSQSLHFADDPEQVLAEAARVVRPGGRVVVVDLQPHDEEWVRDRLGHRTLGFSPSRLRDLLVAADLVCVRAERLDGRSDEPFRPVLACGERRTA